MLFFIAKVECLSRRCRADASVSRVSEASVGLDTAYGSRPRAC
ncbi:hypothetical protein ACFSEO_15265 [Agromyces cerinus subsp. nitratus]